MIIFRTAEVRWFWEGTLQDKITGALEAIHNPLLQESRTDRYIIFPRNPNIGIKVRQGSFEIKSFLKSGDLEVGNKSLLASCEHWQKISISNFRWDLSSTGFTDVIKSRMSCVFLLENAVWKPSDRLPTSNDSCQVELTQIQIRNNSYWTFGLEASGTKQKLCDLLMLIWTKLSKESNLISLLEGQTNLLGALSYPAFFKILNLGDS